MNERDLLELETAARILVTIIERHRVRDEIAKENRALLRIVHDATKTTPDVGTPDEDMQGFVDFTEKEIETMPNKFRRLIIIQKKRCRMRKHQSGANTTTYEIRFRQDGYDVSACGKTIELAKANFIKKLKTAQPKRREENRASIPLTFSSFAFFYFENFRKEKISEQTFKTDSQRLKKHLQPFFKEMPLKKITPSTCKELLDELEERGLGKTGDEIFSLMSIIFKGAIAHGIIERNPLTVIPRIKHEQEHGVALTKEEEKLLFERTTEPGFDVAFALALYCGLRPNELATATVQGDFIKAINSKRKGRKVEYKKIPIIDRLRPYLVNGIPPLPTPQLLRRRIKAALPNHKLYDLRTTFYSRCAELGVAEAAQNEFVGHSLGALGNAYTDLSDEYLLKEGKKLNSW